jgi:hypothetical protein
LFVNLNSIGSCAPVWVASRKKGVQPVPLAFLPPFGYSIQAQPAVEGNESFVGGHTSAPVCHF